MRSTGYEGVSPDYCTIKEPIPSKSMNLDSCWNADNNVIRSVGDGRPSCCRSLT
jgi:hypothetical protein